MDEKFYNVLTMPIHEGGWLKKTLKKRGINQGDFAKKLGISRNTLIIWMKESELTFKSRQDILNVLGMTEEQMMAEASTDESVNTDQGGNHNSSNINYKSSGSIQADALQKLKEAEQRIQALERENELLKEINALLKGGKNQS